MEDEFVAKRPRMMPPPPPPPPSMGSVKRSFNGTVISPSSSPSSVPMDTDSFSRKRPFEESPSSMSVYPMSKRGGRRSRRRRSRRRG